MAFSRALVLETMFHLSISITSQQYWVWKDAGMPNSTWQST